MKIKELHNDITRYLENDCYCPNEIYDTSGFFYRLFYSNDECQRLTETEDFIACLNKDQMIIFWKEESRIIDAVRYDATYNNVSGLFNFIKYGKKFDEDKFDKTGYLKNISQIMNMADAIMIG